MHSLETPVNSPQCSQGNLYHLTDNYSFYNYQKVCIHRSKEHLCSQGGDNMLRMYLLLTVLL